MPLMRDLPIESPGRPDTRSPTRLLVWVGRQQVWSLLIGVAFGITWMVSQALMPYTIGRAIQDGIVEDDGSALVTWALLLLGLGIIQGAAGVMRHRYAVQNWLRAAFLLVQVVSHHVARVGPAVRAQHSTGEVVATVSNDAMRAGGAFDITARGAGAIVSYVVVAAILLSTSGLLGIVVLVGVPVLVLTLGAVIRPLQDRQRTQREEVGKLTALGADTAAGLRVLRGIGGEQAFYGRYREQSQKVRRAGVHVAPPQSTLDAAQVLLPGIFVVIVTWIGARFVQSGRIDAGDLVAFYGYAAFLVIPLRTAAEAVDKITRALVGARRMVAVLEVERAVDEPASRSPSLRPVWRSSTRPPASSSSPVSSPASSRPSPTMRRRSPLGSGASRRRAWLDSATGKVDELSLAAVRRRIVVSEHDPLLFGFVVSLTRGAAHPPTGPCSTRSPSRTRRTSWTRSAGARCRGRRAWPLVLGGPAPAARARPCTRLRPGDPRSSSSTSAVARAHRGSNRPRSALGAGGRHCDRDDEPLAPIRPIASSSLSTASLRRSGDRALLGASDAYRDTVTRGESE